MLIVDIFQKVLKEAKSRLGEILSAFEFVDRPALEMVIVICSCHHIIRIEDLIKNKMGKTLRYP